MRITGFGACMIKGAWVDAGQSFFDLFVNQISMNGLDEVKSEVISLKGFTAERAVRHIGKVVKSDPDIVIVQFGTSDCYIPVRKRLRVKCGLDGSSKGNSNSTFLSSALTRPRSFNILDDARWLISGLMSYTLSLSPMSTPDVYVASIESLIKTLTNNKIVPIVLSPFVLKNFASNRFARQLTDRIRSLTEKYDFMFVDCHQALSKYSKRDVLLPTGIHLNALGHRVVFEEIWNVYRNNFRTLPELSVMRDSVQDCVHQASNSQKLLGILQNKQVLRVPEGFSRHSSP